MRSQYTALKRELKRLKSTVVSIDRPDVAYIDKVVDGSGYILTVSYCNNTAYNRYPQNRPPVITHHSSRQDAVSHLSMLLSDTKPHRPFVLFYGEEDMLD